MRIYCINPPKFVKAILRLFCRGEKKDRMQG